VPENDFVHTKSAAENIDKPEGDDQPSLADAELSDEELIAIAKKHFQIAADADSDIRAAQTEDLKFLAGDQWPAEIKQRRDLKFRPCITVNKLPQYSNQIINSARQNRPSIKVNPVDDRADIETAKILQGHVRHIQYNSNADVAYDTSLGSAVDGGRGFFRVLTAYVSPMSFEQEILIKKISNPLSVYLDPSYQEPDGSDANWAIIFEDISVDEFRAQYPNAKLASLDAWRGIGGQEPDWANKTNNTIRIAEYFYKSFKKTTICLLSNGHVVDKAKLPPGIAFPDGVKIVRERETVLPAIKWCKHNAIEPLEKTDWLGDWIPVIPVHGNERIVDGKRIFEGIVRHSKDSQRALNYFISAETEIIALAPKAPFIGYAGQFEGHEDKWNSANIENYPYLEVNPVTIDGKPAPLPQRNAYEPATQAITNARMLASEDMKSTTGMYDAAMGMKSDEKSGVAITRRTQQSETNNFHFIDNLNRSIRHAGRIIVQLIPQIYDTERMIRIMGEDGTPEMVKVNGFFEKDGKNVAYHLSAGKYDVTVDTGPSYQTKRQEAAETMLEFIRVMPAAAPLISDLIARNMDWPGAQEVADRLKKTLPPGIAEDKNKEKNSIPPEAQAEIAKMGQMIEALTQELNAANEQVRTKKMELESKERVEYQKIQAQIEIEMAKLGSAESIELLRQEVAQLERKMAAAGDQEQIEENQTEFGASGAGAPLNQQPGSMPG
jgi:hypothetical protein